jgi:hypothetical protein
MDSTRHPNPVTPRTLRSGTAAPLVAALLVAGAGAACGSASAGSVRPTHTGPTHTRAARHGPTVCGRPATAPGVGAGGAGGSGPVVAAAARLSATVTVVPKATGPACRVLETGKHVVIGVGQRVQFVANDVPAVTGSGVETHSAPGPRSPGPLRTTHLVITLTAVQPGTVTVGWIDCSGTGC